MYPVFMITLKVVQWMNNIVKANCSFFAVIDSDDSMIIKLCGTITDIAPIGPIGPLGTITRIAPIFSSSNFMTIVFKTDNSRNATGFKASWSSLEVEGKIIKSPNYPLFYPNDADQVKRNNRN